MVEFDSKNELPLTYEPDILKDYYSKRPLLVLRRLAQVIRTPHLHISSKPSQSIDPSR